ncbi:glycoside hydrolase family 3 N-terminal domain-containing protein [Enterovibrio paralichthyis]|uniref:glycoside hydrolase family 3 N-terminal domain-containing protein n=1 Tax=Enterovibrio paralichthyis TaxID=2853805 RepID=UPI001C47551F|nr:glycoside hydrolase family 3 N-terminal domain-containing protein [Enterovibrio paralichthyis]MBV7298083.1 glycosyl hydrolase family 3 [Enterovibrio paralichthyis]
MNPIEQQIAKWSLKEKIGQLFILAFPGKTADTAAQMIAEYNLGGCYLSQDNAETFEEAHVLNKGLDALLKQHDRLPLLLGVDQEGAWGVLVGESTTGPGNLALGVAEEVSGTANMYRVFGEEMRSAGFNCILGPCCDVNLNPASPIIDTRSFGDVPSKVSAHSAAAVKGLHQGDIVACAKHFPGHGDTHGDTHREIPRVDKSYDELKANDLAPFQAAIDAGVDLIMTSHILYPQLDDSAPATLSPVILQNVLRGDMGFEGIIISDSMNMGAIQNHYQPVDAAVKAMKAGITMIMLSEEHYDHSDAYLDKQLAMIHGLIDAVETGELAESVIDDAVKRVVAFKLAKLVPQTLYQPFSFAENREVAQQAANEGVVWLRGGLKDVADKPLYLLNATPKSSYHNLMNPRGIGPNQAQPAFDAFRDELAKLHTHCQVVTKDTLPNLDDGYLVVVTENHPLPGEDFDQVEAKQTVQQLSRDFSNLVVVGLRSPYDALEYPDVVNYLCAHSPRPESAVAAARVLLSKQAASTGVAVSRVN